MRYLTLFCAAVYVLRLQIEWSKRRLLLNSFTLIVGATGSVHTGTVHTGSVLQVTSSARLV